MRLAVLIALTIGAWFFAALHRAFVATLALSVIGAIADDRHDCRRNE